MAWLQGKLPCACLRIKQCRFMSKRPRHAEDSLSTMLGSAGNHQYELVLRLNKIKRLDMKTSIDIAGVANCSVRDLSGNLLPFVWTRQSVSNEYENATLLSREALQKHLQNFIDAGVKENIEILQKVNDPALLVDWVVRTAEHWELRYAEKRNEKYDISQAVFSAMFEATFETAWPLLVDSFGLDDSEINKYQNMLSRKIEELAEDPACNKYHQQLLQYISESTSLDERKLESFFWIHRGSNALVRLLFRSDSVPGLREHLCMLAGKMLQKKEVCNKAGTYSSHRQRSDVLQEWFYAVRDFKIWLEQQTVNIMSTLTEIFNKPEWIFLIIDHTAVPLTLLPLRTPVPTLTRAPVVCSQCQQSLDMSRPHKD